MEEISLRKLLEAGCHFGHKADRWHPKAAKFIFDAREGVHIIDLVKTRDGLKAAAAYMKQLGEEGKNVLYVASKRQARGVVTEAAQRAGIAYLTNRWIGGFFTNWEEVKKNIDKMNKARKEKTDGTWNKFLKHEVVKLNKLLHRQEVVYEGVAQLTSLPDAIFIIDIKKEVSSLREAQKRHINIIAIVDTNTDPTPVDYPIPSNDDAVGSIQIITNFLTDAYLEGKKIAEKGKGETKATGGVLHIEKSAAENAQRLVEVKKESAPIKKEEVKKSEKALVKKEKKEDVKASTKKEKPAKKAAKTKKAKK